MTVEVTEEAMKTPAVRGPETGWARARRLRGQTIRTCVRAKTDGDPGQPRSQDDWNVVLGED